MITHYEYLRFQEERQRFHEKNIRHCKKMRELFKHDNTASKLYDENIKMHEDILRRILLIKAREMQKSLNPPVKKMPWYKRIFK